MATRATSGFVTEQTEIPTYATARRHPRFQMFSVVLGASEVTDTVSPSLAVIAPPFGSTIARDTPLSFTLTDNINAKLAVVIVRFPALGIWEVVYDGTDFAPAYTGSVSKPDVKTMVFTDVVRKAGWLSAFEFKVVLTDASGNLA